MFDHIRQEVQDKVRDLRYVMTAHAEDEADADELPALDVEHGILTGTIVERQRDVDRGLRKYLIKRNTLAGDGIGVVVESSLTGKVVITVFLLEGGDGL